MTEEPQLSITQMTTFHWSLPDLVTYCKDFGFPAIGVWLPRLNEFGEERGIDLLLESQLAVSSVGPAGGFTGAHGHSFDDSVLDTHDALQTAAKLGADTLTVYTGPRAGHTRGHSRRLVTSALEELADAAGELQVALALKPMAPVYAEGWTFLHSLRAAADLIDECDHPALKLAFGTFHCWQEPELAALIPQLAPLIGSVQLSDGTRQPDGEWDHRLLGEGEIPLPEIVQLLLDADYDGFFEIDIWSRELWQSSYGDLLAHCRDQFVRAAAVQR